MNGLKCDVISLIPVTLYRSFYNMKLRRNAWIRVCELEQLIMHYPWIFQINLDCTVFFFLYYSISAWLKTFHTRENRKTHTSNALFKAYTSSINSNVYGRSNVISCNFESIGFVLWIIDRIKCTAPVTRRQFQMNFKYSRSIVVQVSS